MFGSDINEFETPHTRPDIVLIDHENRSVLINEIAIPYDCHISKCFQSKFEKYTPLAQQIGALGYNVQTIVLLIGSMGSVHKKFISGLLKNNIKKQEAKYLAKFSSISAQIGGFKIWRKRCSLLDTATRGHHV